MTVSLKKFLLAASLFIAPTFAAAKPMVFECVITNDYSKNWIAQQIFVEVDAEANSARVVDPIIMYFAKKPATAKLLSKDNGKFVVSWGVFMHADGRRQRTRMAYRASILTNNGKFAVVARPTGYADQFTARGKCRQSKSPFPIS